MTVRRRSGTTSTRATRRAILRGFSRALSLDTDLAAGMGSLCRRFHLRPPTGHHPVAHGRYTAALRLRLRLRRDGTWDEHGHRLRADLLRLQRQALDGRALEGPVR